MKSMEMFDYGNAVLANFKHQGIQQIAEEGGAIAFVGPDVNMEGKHLLPTDFEIISVTEKSCISSIELKINNELIEKEFSCYKRGPTQCDQLGLERYIKFNNSFNEYKELLIKCPCDIEPRPSQITDNLLKVPKSRNKRSVNNNPLLGTKDADGLVRGCENSENIGFGDILWHPDDVPQKMENQQVGKYSEHDLEFINRGNSCSATIGDMYKNKAEGSKIVSHHVNVPWSHGCGTVGVIIHEVMHALGLDHEQKRKDRNESGSWSQYYRGQTLDFGTPYDFGSIMHYNPISRVNIDPDTYSILALEHEYQNTMGQRVGHSFKDIKLLNRLYCTIDYPFTSSLSKSINFGCETKEYELNGGKCKNGGYPDPLKNCACRCPEGHGGRYCTEYKYENCKAVELTAKVKKQAISTTDFSCLYVVKAKQANDKIKAKRILINVETILFQCNHPCQDNYIEIKYLKDKSATG
uniref:Metalloendopeptidase n=1 Tax=Meloidogyne hapla TaxID=6305 RepID=A0A1I8BVI4_MELHA